MTFDACALDIFSCQMEITRQCLALMLRGVCVDPAVLAGLDAEVVAAMAERTRTVETLLGKPFDKFNDHGEPTFFRSAPQITALFAQLGVKPGVHRKTGKGTFDDETLYKIGQKTPALQTLCHAIIEYRSLGQMLSTFVRAKLEPDGKMRCTFNASGPETYRLSSSKNAFGRGCNLQNVSTGDRGLTRTPLPNLRRAIVPSPGHVMWEPDLAGADARVVAWDSDDGVLKQMFREGVALHAVTAREVYGNDAGPDGRREPYYTLAKKARHLWHYAGKERTMAASLGITVHEAGRVVKRFSGLNPGIPRWHNRVRQQLYETRTIRNAFGYRIIYLGRPEELLPDALAWIGQGTVACAINRAWVNIAHNVPDAVVLLQEHDSLPGETREELWPATKPLIREQFNRVVIPYPEPLVIPPSLKTSRVSWGDMKSEEW